MTGHRDAALSVTTDEDGAGCASAEAADGGVAYGEGDTAVEALTDLRSGPVALSESIGALEAANTA
ncbi:hypothetical protein [Nocardiopsis sp. CNT312]|uniref:hypothetical protein n=1 Tax=Nocardiopsis sp. CNT312 TaxID=1137268 RepID=UPI0004B82FD8|nr:hypothetical protein [Nocardiopsis sp. CNT312]